MASTASFDRPTRRWVPAACSLAISAVCISVALSATTIQPPVALRWLWAVPALASLWFAVALVRQRLAADANGVQVRNLASRFSIA